MQSEATDLKAQGLEKNQAKVVGAYVRVSTTRQGEEGQSLEEQTRRLKILHDLKYPENELEIFQDVKSASSGRRPEFQTLNREIRKRNVRSVLCVSLDRLFRRNKEAVEFLSLLEETSTELVILDAGIDTSTPVGRCFFAISAAFAELEAHTNGERVKRTHQANYLKGRRGPGCRPFGWNTDSEKNLIPNEREQQFITYCLEERETGRSWGDLARHATRLGIFGVTGKQFSPQSLQSSILNATRRREVDQRKAERENEETNS